MSKFGVYTNFVGIKKDMEEVSNLALEQTAEEMLDELRKFIKSDIYDNYHPKWYNRKGDVLRAFDIAKAGSIGGLGIRGQLKIKVNEDEIDYYTDGENWIHGNPQNELTPKSFLEILNDSSKIGDAFGFPHIEREPFWDDFLNWANENFVKIYNKYYIKAYQQITGQRYKVSAKVKK